MRKFIVIAIDTTNFCSVSVSHMNQDTRVKKQNMPDRTNSCSCLCFPCTKHLLCHYYYVLTSTCQKWTPRFSFNKIRKHWIHRQKASIFCINTPVDVQITCSLTVTMDTVSLFCIEPIFSLSEEIQYAILGYILRH